MTRKEKKNQTRKAIIEAAIALFGRRGFEKTSIEALAQRAGVGKGTIYSYFKTKSDIFYAFCEEQLEFIHSELASKTDPDAPVIEQVMTVFMGEFLHVTNNREFGRFFMRQVLFPDHRNKSSYEKVDKQWLELLFSIYKRAQDRGELRKDIDLLYHAGHFYALYILVISSWYSGRIEKEEVEPAMRLLFEQTLEGLRPLSTDNVSTNGEHHAV